MWRSPLGNYTPEAMACTLDKIHEGVEDINKHIEPKGQLYDHLPAAVPAGQWRLGGLNAANRGAFQECAGNSCQSIIGLHDRISAAQQASNQGFFQLDTKICESIANVISAVQAERNHAEVLAGQKDIMCKMSTMALEAENARLQRELCECKNNALATSTASAEVNGMASADEKAALVDFLNELLKEVSK